MSQEDPKPEVPADTFKSTDEAEAANAKNTAKWIADAKAASKTTKHK